MAAQAHAEALETTFIKGLDGDLVPLRAAAIASQYWLYVFDLDATIPACHVLSPFASAFKVKGSYRENGTKKARAINDAAWSPILGKDVLPKDMVDSNMYSRKKMAVLLKTGNKYHSCVHKADSDTTAPADLKAMAVSFVAVTCIPQQLRQYVKGGKKHSRQTGKVQYLQLSSDFVLVMDIRQTACYCSVTI